MERIHYFSIDVGILNLACCKLCKDCKIKDWKLINLASGSNKLTCVEPLKSKEGICGNKALYLNSEGKGICKKHSNDTMERNYTFKNITDHELRLRLFSGFDKLVFDDVAEVLIEKQPPKATEKMKMLAHAIYDYFLLKHPEIKVRVVDAKHKLTVYDGPPISCHLTTPYTRNKWYGKKYCEYIMNSKGETEWKEYYLKNKKKNDDLADCYLQGLWYIMYGQYGIKVPPNKEQDTLVLHESNMIAYKKAKAVSPRGKSKLYNIKHIKYLVGKGEPLENELLKSIEFFFGDVEYFKTNK